MALSNDLKFLDEFETQLCAIQEELRQAEVPQSIMDQINYLVEVVKREKKQKSQQ